MAELELDLDILTNHAVTNRQIKVFGGEHHACEESALSAVAQDARSQARERRSAIESAFGSFGDFQGKFKDAGVNQFGSGWAWLVHDGSGLEVTSTPNLGNSSAQIHRQDPNRARPATT